MNNIYGNHLGIVISHPQEDPENRGRCQIFIPHITNTIYNLWNDLPEDKVINTLNDIPIDIIRKLKIVLPWAECAAPIFGGATSNYYNPVTGKTSSTPQETMADGGGGGKNPNSIDEFGINSAPDTLPPAQDENLPDVVGASTPSSYSENGDKKPKPLSYWEDANNFPENSDPNLDIADEEAVNYPEGVLPSQPPEQLDENGEPPLPI